MAHIKKNRTRKTLEKDGKGVCAWLGSAASKPADLNPQLAARVYDLYLPVYYWCKDVVEKNPTKPTVIFMSAPQGCGKTTICDALVERFAADGKQCAALSYDDFYLTHAEQNEVAKTHENNRLLELRGNGGTHDLQLFDDVLTCVESKSTSVSGRPPRHDAAVLARSSGEVRFATPSSSTSRRWRGPTR